MKTLKMKKKRKCEMTTQKKNNQQEYNDLLLKFVLLKREKRERCENEVKERQKVMKRKGNER